jgi:hypothetical protein
MATASESSRRTETIIVQHQAPAGVLAGALACVFGLLGVFFIGLIFVPLAALCAIIGLVRGVGSGSGAAIGLSIIGGFLSVAGFAVSPSLWVLLGAGLLTGLIATHHPASAVAYPPHVLGPSASVPYSVGTPNPMDLIPAKANNLIQRMQRFDNIADGYLNGISEAKLKYQAQTAKLNGYFQCEKNLVGYENASVSRGQLSVAISQGAVATDQFHIQIQSMLTQLGNQIAPLEQAVNALKLECQGVSNSTSDTIAWKTSCQDFNNTREEAGHKFDALKSGFAQLEAVYQQEHQRQENLVNASEQIE